MKGMMIMSIGPKDFDPFRSEIRGCACDHCQAVAFAHSDVLDMGGRKHLKACEDLLTALREGRHAHMSYAERSAIAREQNKRRIAQAIADGRSEAYIESLRRGYVSVKMSDFYATGMGIGMTPHDR